MRDRNARYSMSAKRWAWLALGLCTVMMFPWQADAKPKPALTMTAAFDSARPELNRNEILRVTLTSTKSYANLAVAVSLPEEIALVSGKPEYKGVLNASEKREIVLTVMLKTTGRYTINVNAAFDPAESSFTSAQSSLNIIAEGSSIVAAMEPFEMMDWKRAKTSADKKKIISTRGIETQTPAPTGTPPPVPSFLQKEKPAAPAKPESRVGDSISVQVSGVMKYQDKAGTEHPIRYAKVKVYDADVVGEELMGEGNTLADGSYSIACYGGDIGSGPDIVVRVYCDIMNDAVAFISPDKNPANVPSMDSAEHTDFEGSALTVSLTTGKPVSGSVTDDTNARLFSVLDAILHFSAEACYLRDFNLMPRIPVVYPGSDTFYDGRVDPVWIELLRADGLDWDVIGHEYGHFVASKGASSRFDTSMGGNHDGSSTIPSNGKDRGVRLAWSEGWATFFAILAQVEPTQNMLALPGVPNSGDRIYHDTEDGNSADDQETFSNTALTGKGQGYACERSISGMLYDLCDANIDTSVDGTSKDNVDITIKQVWNILNSSDMDDVGKFYNALCSLVGYDVATILFFSPVFALNNIGPELETPAEGTAVSSVISPEFKWKANGDPNAGYQHDKFDLIIAKNNFTELVGIKENIADTKYTFTEAEWEAITAQSPEDGVFQWAVTGYNSANPRLPTAAGLGKFVSNTQNFKLRAYHVRMTWDKVGVDVDLHLSAPGKTDCYYANRNPDWGVIGDTSDNPSLDRDCITSCAEENLTIDKVVDPGDYRFWAHYYSDHNQGGTMVTVEIFKYGRSIGGASQYLAETGDSWTVFDFSVGAHPGMDIVAVNPGEVARGVSVLPAKQQEE